MYDVIVVGARCAGSPVAMLLARKGYRVLLLDRATFPSDAPRNHFIHPAGTAYLALWGLLEKVAASNCPPINRWTLNFGPVVLTGDPSRPAGAPPTFAPRRRVLDKILVDAAVDAGAELRESFNVDGLVDDGDRVSGVQGRSRGGSSVTERARVVVGADGLHSFVAKAVRAPIYNERPTCTCTYFSYWSGVPRDGFELYMRPGRVIFVFPTNDDQLLVNVGWPHREFHGVRADIEGNYLAALDVVPGLRERVCSGRREERFAGTADMPNFFRQAHGPGWALVGDAGYHKDYYTAQGITDAFRDADLLAKALDAGLEGSTSLEVALADYQRHRDQAVMPMYELTCQLATLEPPPPEMRQLIAALQANQAETDRFMGVLADVVPVQDFFAPENVRRIMQAGSMEPQRSDNRQP